MYEFYYNYINPKYGNNGHFYTSDMPLSNGIPAQIKQRQVAQLNAAGERGVCRENWLLKLA